jgi:hypothetical protein
MAEAHYYNRQDENSEKLHGEKEVGPTCGFTASPEVGLEATVSTLQTEYPRMQASSQEKEWGVQPCATTCPTAPEPASLVRRAPTPPRVSWLQTRGEGFGAPHVLYLRILPPCGEVKVHLGP